MFRIALVLIVITVGAILAGFYGAFLAFFLCGLIGGMIGSPEPRQVRPSPQASLPADERTEARKGKRIDPTAPTHEDWGGMIQNLKARR